MQIKNVLKRNYITLIEADKEVIKSARTPFRGLTRAWCRHEAGCLRDLAALGFVAAPRLIRCDNKGFVMELVDGVSLNKRKVIAEALFIRVLDVVEHLHRCGFAHGNLRPSNILVNAADQPVLIDFETCCSRHNPLFFLARFNDQVRMRLLWQRSVAPYMDDQTSIEWPGYITAVSWVITAVNRLVRPLKAAKKRWKMSGKRTRSGD